MGNKIDRRKFLKGLGAVSGTTLASTLTNGFTFSVPQALAQSIGARKMVLFEMDGGKAGFSILFRPPDVGATQAYYDMRPVEAGIIGTALPLNGTGGHTMAGELPALQTSFNAGEVAILAGHARLDQSRSHGTARAVHGIYGSSGWLAKLLSLQSANDPLNGFQRNDNLAFQNSSVVVGDLDSYGYAQGGADAQEARVIGSMLSQGGNGPHAQLYGTGVQNAADLEALIAQAVAFEPQVPFGNSGIERQLEDVLAFFVTFPQSVCASVRIGGFDTHNGHWNQLANRLPDINAAYDIFRQNCILEGLWNNVVVAEVSEFGRTAFQNGNEGLDHGEGTATFLAGGAVVGGVYGSPIDAAQIDYANNVRNQWPRQHDTVNAVYGPVAQYLTGGTVDLEAIFGPITGDIFNYLPA